MARAMYRSGGFTGTVNGGQGMLPGLGSPAGPGSPAGNYLGASAPWSPKVTFGSPGPTSQLNFAGGQPSGQGSPHTVGVNPSGGSPGHHRPDQAAAAAEAAYAALKSEAERAAHARESERAAWVQQQAQAAQAAAAAVQQQHHRDWQCRLEAVQGCSQCLTVIDDLMFHLDELRKQPSWLGYPANEGAQADAARQTQACALAQLRDWKQVLQLLITQLPQCQSLEDDLVQRAVSTALQMQKKCSRLQRILLLEVFNSSRYHSVVAELGATSGCYDAVAAAVRFGCRFNGQDCGSSWRTKVLEEPTTQELHDTHPYLVGV